AWGLVARAPYCTQTAQTSCRSASPSPIELRRARKAGPDRHALSLANASGGDLASASLARDHDGSSEAKSLSGFQEENAEGEGASQKAKTPSACSRCGVKNLYL